MRQGWNAPSGAPACEAPDGNSAINALREWLQQDSI